ncbi:MAG: hypothetical protein VB099_02780 [Candidatus Limiplasma sp.]|nr:hypothetical protein [Candidatus Limiplasma sp.]
MKKFSLGILVGLILGALLTGSIFIRNVQVTSSNEGYTITIWDHDFHYR